MAGRATAWVNQVLGEHTEVAQLPANRRKVRNGQRVRLVADGDATRWVVKEVAAVREWRAERRALRQWAPALGDRVPRLVAADEELRVLLMSALPGEHPGAGCRRASRAAGTVLRRIHDSRPPRHQPPRHREAADTRVERLIEDSRGVLGSSHEGLARHRAEQMAALPLGHLVPCHGDYRPHNWLVDSSGTLRVIDFGKARWQVPAWDLAPMFFRPWWRRPRLAAAFLAGYGRLLDPREAAFLEGQMAVAALAHAAFGATRGSERHVGIARARLARLEAGHRVVPHWLVERGGQGAARRRSDFGRVGVPDRAGDP